LDSLYLLIPVALVFVAIGIKLLLWAIDSGQYDDLDKEAWRILAADKNDGNLPPSEPERDPEKPPR
jgi:cbb3-type cytochrome oxidase maturation protein